MSTHYTVAQFVPDPIAGEAINIGVLAWSDTSIHTSMIRDWRRVSAFANCDIGFLRDFSKEIRKLTQGQKSLPSLGRDGALAVGDLEEMVSSWRNLIQFTPARFSTKPAELLVKDIAKIFLKVRTPIRHTHRKEVAVKTAISVLEEVLIQKGRIQPDRYIRKDASLKGRIDQHSFDIVVRNGSLISALNTLSFSNSSENDLTRDIDATAWKVDDVRREHKGLSVCVLGIHTNEGNTQALNRAKKIFRSLKVSLVEQPQLKRWASNNIRIPNN